MLKDLKSCESGENWLFGENLSSFGGKRLEKL